VPSKADIISATCRAQEGDPYVWSAEDCSEQVSDWMDAIHLGVARTTANDLYHRCTPISRPTKVGDMGFHVDSNDHASHVGTFIGGPDPARNMSEAKGRAYGTLIDSIADFRADKWGRWPGLDTGDLTPTLKLYSVRIGAFSHENLLKLVDAVNHARGVKFPRGKLHFHAAGEYNGKPVQILTIGPYSKPICTRTISILTKTCGVGAGKVHLVG
jgi:hypothetical protein